MIYLLLYGLFHMITDHIIHSILFKDMYRYNYIIPMPEKEIVTSIDSRHILMELIKQNPGHIVIKLGADWCGPCKRIEKNVKDFFLNCPPNVLCCDIDIDESFDMYAYLKSKRMVDGVPTVLVYSNGNSSFIPDHIHSGGDVVGFESFASAMLRNFSK